MYVYIYINIYLYIYTYMVIDDLSWWLVTYYTHDQGPAVSELRQQHDSIHLFPKMDGSV